MHPHSGDPPKVDLGPKKLSTHKGVNWDKATGKWLVRISVDGKQKYLGRFTEEHEAATALEVAQRTAAETQSTLKGVRWASHLHHHSLMSVS